MTEFAYYYLNFEVMAQYLPTLLVGLRITAVLALLVTVIGIGLGLILAVLRSFRIRLLTAAIVVVVDILRSIPPLMLLIFAYFALPYVGLTLPSMTAAVLCLSLILAAFAEEIFWACILSVDKGQWEAARATGMSFLAILFLVILPQAIRMGIPDLTNRTIAITKATSLASAIAVPELINRSMSAQSIAASPSPLMLGAALYLVLFFPLVVGSRLLEKRIRGVAR